MHNYQFINIKQINNMHPSKIQLDSLLLVGQIQLFNTKIKQRKPDLKFKKQAYSNLDINQKINLKSWFFSDPFCHKDVFWNFINQCMVLVNINNNDYYTSGMK